MDHLRIHFQKEFHVVFECLLSPLVDYFSPQKIPLDQDRQRLLRKRVKSTNLEFVVMSYRFDLVYYCPLLKEINKKKVTFMVRMY